MEGATKGTRLGRSNPTSPPPQLWDIFSRGPLSFKSSRLLRLDGLMVEGWRPDGGTRIAGVDVPACKNNKPAIGSLLIQNKRELAADGSTEGSSSNAPSAKRRDREGNVEPERRLFPLSWRMYNNAPQSPAACRRNGARAVSGKHGNNESQCNSIG